MCSKLVKQTNNDRTKNQEDVIRRPKANSKKVAGTPRLVLSVKSVCEWSSESDSKRVDHPKGSKVYNSEYNII